jgi:hypothetical protein
MLGLAGPSAVNVLVERTIGFSPGLSPSVFASTLLQNDRSLRSGPGVAELLTEDVGPVGIWRRLRKLNRLNPSTLLARHLSLPHPQLWPISPSANDVVLTRQPSISTFSAEKESSSLQSGEENVDIVDLEEINEGGDISRMRRTYKRGEGDHGRKRREGRIGAQRIPDPFPVFCANICNARKGERAQCASANSPLCNISERAEHAVSRPPPPTKVRAWSGSTVPR